ncbi:TRAP transporter small permease [Petroclostridium sp. X23]|uniref:TRAP transporter small permease n=1 Tax=Petroclostridium sp. X23 TaxID=3045146 RepID=UPI0024AE6F34|nr:TRAP transporter small permease [Petroclostridium sp. X23]WHH61570.1 TRAP transporter small permease [Petroclostridium sp. X23]
MKKILDNIEEYLLIFLFPIMTVIVFIATATRYLKLGAIPWSEELARYIMIWMAYIGAGLAVKKNAHLGVEAFVSLMPASVVKYLSKLRIAILILFNGMVIYFSFKIMIHQMNIGQTSPALQIPIWVAYLAMPTGALLMCIRTIQSVFPVKNNTSEGRG